MKKIALIIGSMIAAVLFLRQVLPGLTGLNRPQKKRRPQNVKILFWYDPMYPNTRFDKPGKSPFMDMDIGAEICR